MRTAALTVTRCLCSEEKGCGCGTGGVPMICQRVHIARLVVVKIKISDDLKRDSSLLSCECKAHVTIVTVLQVVLVMVLILTGYHFATTAMMIDPYHLCQQQEFCTPVFMPMLSSLIYSLYTRYPSRIVWELNLNYRLAVRISY